jgi:phenylacetate-CoA ligase
MKQTEMREIAIYAYQHTRFYRNLYDKYKVDVYTCPLPNGLPVVEPADLAKYASDFRTDEDVFKLCFSSGTSLLTKTLFRTSDDFERSVENQIQLMRWAKIQKNDIVGIIQPFGLWGYGELTLEACRKMGVLAIPVGGTVDDNENVKLIRSFNITIVDITPSRLIRILKIMGKRGSIKTAMLAGEYLTNKDIDLIQKKYGVKIFNQYGCSECDALGSSIEDTHLIKTLDSFVYEIDDNGSLVITSLYHHGTPIVRYRLGDSVKFAGEYINLGVREQVVLLDDGIKMQDYQITNCLGSDKWQCLVRRKKRQIYLLSNGDIQNISEIADFIKQCGFTLKVYSASFGYIETTNKFAKFLDLDKADENVILIQTVSCKYYELFVDLLPFPFTKKSAIDIYQCLAERIHPNDLLDIGMFLVRKWNKTTRAIGDKIIRLCYEQCHDLLFSKMEVLCVSDDWVDREEGAKLLSVMLSQCFDLMLSKMREYLASDNVWMRRAALLSTKYSVQETSDTKTHELLINTISPLFFDDAVPIRKIYCSFVIGDGYMRICPDLIMQQIMDWEKEADTIHIGNIIDIFASSCGPKHTNMVYTIIKPYIDSPDVHIQKSIARTATYLRRHSNDAVITLLKELNIQEKK